MDFINNIGLNNSDFLIGCDSTNKENKKAFSRPRVFEVNITFNVSNIGPKINWEFLN